MPRTQTLQDMFVHELRDIYDAEQQIMKTLPALVRSTHSKPLATALEEHLTETRTHLSRLESVFAKLDVRPKGTRCQGMEGILAEGQQLLGHGMDDATFDAALIGTAQRVEHYETAVYGTLAAWARRLEHEEIASLLVDTLREEERADAKLTELAETGINAAAAGA